MMNAVSNEYVHYVGKNVLKWNDEKETVTINESTLETNGLTEALAAVASDIKVDNDLMDIPIFKGIQGSRSRLHHYIQLKPTPKYLGEYSEDNLELFKFTNVSSESISNADKRAMCNLNSRSLDNTSQADKAVVRRFFVKKNNGLVFDKDLTCKKERSKMLDAMAIMKKTIKLLRKDDSYEMNGVEKKSFIEGTILTNMCNEEEKLKLQLECAIKSKTSTVSPTPIKTPEDAIFQSRREKTVKKFERIEDGTLTSKEK